MGMRVVGRGEILIERFWRRRSSSGVELEDSMAGKRKFFPAAKADLGDLVRDLRAKYGDESGRMRILSDLEELDCDQASGIG